jgi:hypothetical protein
MRPLVLTSLSLAVIGCAAIGCAASSENLFPPPGTTGSGASGGGGSATGGDGSGAAGTGGDQGLGGGFDVGDAGTGTGSDCSAAAQLAYVFSQAGDIYSFDPPTKAFTKIATPGCSGSANSMAIDRNLVAWLNYVGTIYTYDLNQKNGCKPSGITLPVGFDQVGMGFSTDVAGGTSETLYLSSIAGSGLGKVDMATKTVVSISSSGAGGELTGTGDARLFAYFTSPVSVAQLDKTTGAILNDNALANVTTPFDWAFSFWGGDFYVYAAPEGNADGNSSVIQYDPGTNAVTTYIHDVGFAIVGAGVSTCAPLTPPQ